MKFFLPIILLFFSSICFGQDLKVYESNFNNKTISFKELIEKLINTKKDIYIRNVKVVWDESTDREYMDGRFNSIKEPETIIIENRLLFVDCEFDVEYFFVLRNIKFLRNISFKNCSNLKFNFKNVTFNNPISFNSNCFIEFLNFERCTFYGFALKNVQVTGKLIFDHCKMEVANSLPYFVSSFHKGSNLFSIDNRLESINLKISNCSFNKENNTIDKKINMVNLSNSVFSQLKIEDCDFNTPLLLESSTIENTLIMKKNLFNHPIVISNLNINDTNFKIAWKDIDRGILNLIENEKLLNAEKILSEKRNDLTQALFSDYSLIYNALKDQGNRLEANQCYVEWKDIETKWFQKTAIGKDRKFFIYLSNKFLSFFCDYGTNPLKALFSSFYIVCLFSIFYMGRLTYNQDSFIFVFFTLIKSRFDKIQFFRHRKIFTRKFEYEKSPLFLKEKGLVNRCFFIINNSTNLKSKKKTFIFASLLGLLVLSILQISKSIIISLNVFSTLGFGRIPQKGFLKYVAVIQGFIGWILLSVFSVSLINQIIY